MSDKKCPVCGADTISFQKKSKIIKNSLGKEAKISINIYSCSVCGTSGDFFDENDTIVSRAIKLLDEASVNDIVNNIKEKGSTLASIERVLGLSQRTLTKWRTGATKPSSASVALFKFIKLFPWLLHVADSRYDKETADRILLNEVLFKLSKYDELLTAITDDECLIYGKRSVTSMESLSAVNVQIINIF